MLRISQIPRTRRLGLPFLRATIIHQQHGTGFETPLIRGGPDTFGKIVARPIARGLKRPFLLLTDFQNAGELLEVARGKAQALCAEQARLSQTRYSSRVAGRIVSVD